VFNAKNYDKIYPDRKKEIDFLLEHLEGKKVIDIGGGTGKIAEELNKKGFECWNVEPQIEMAEISRSRGVKTIWESGENFKTGIIFDNAIMMFNVFNFLDNPHKVLENISGILSGKLIFTYCNYEVRKKGWEFNWKLKRLSRKRWNGDEVKIDFWFPFFHERHIMRVYPHKVIEKMLYRNDFKIIDRFRTKYETIIIAEI